MLVGRSAAYPIHSSAVTPLHIRRLLSAVKLLSGGIARRQILVGRYTPLRLRRTLFFSYVFNIDRFSMTYPFVARFGVTNVLSVVGGYTTVVHAVAYSSAVLRLKT